MNFYEKIVQKVSRNQESSFKIKLKKFYKYGAIPLNILKQTIEVHLKYQTSTMNHFSKKIKNSWRIKKSELILLCKRLDALQMENYRPESLLTRISKVFEKVI